MGVSRRRRGGGRRRRPLVVEADVHLGAGAEVVVEEAVGSAGDGVEVDEHRPRLAWSGQL